MHVVAFGASNSKTSINDGLARRAAQVFATEISKGSPVQFLNLNKFEMSIYSLEREVRNGKPALFMSASGSERGGGTVLATTIEAAPYLGGDVRAHFAVGLWQEKFDEVTESLADPDPPQKLREGLSLLTFETAEA